MDFKNRIVRDKLICGVGHTIKCTRITLRTVLPTLSIVTTISQIIVNAPTLAVMSATQRSGRFLITQDLDFSDLRRFAPGTHEGLLLVRLRNPGRLSLVLRVRTLFETEAVEAWKGCFVVATDRKLRIRRP